MTWESGVLHKTREPVAQLAVRGPLKPTAAGSSPAGFTNLATAWKARTATQYSQTFQESGAVNPSWSYSSVRPLGSVWSSKCGRLPDEFDAGG